MAKQPRSKPNWAARAAVAGFLSAGFGMQISGALAAEDQAPSREEMWQMIQEQQRQIEALKEERATGDSADVEVLEKRLRETEQKLDAAASAIEQRSAGGEEGWWNRTSIGGYGELHYNGGKADEVDFHRFVLFVGHRFNDWIRLQSEVELEHALAGEGKEGEVELEQAFIEMDLTEGAGLSFGNNDRHFFQAGVMLVPVGILNETHEPPTFFGVERNTIEHDILPATWWEAGIGMKGDFGQGFGYDVMLHSGLDVPSTGGDAFNIRDGRNKVSEAPANNPAVTGRLTWNAMPGVQIGVTGQYQDDVTQGDLGVDATLLEAHADIRRGGFGLRALYARWDLSGPEPALSGRDEQYGWYVEPSYRFQTGEGEIGIFTRYEVWDDQAGIATPTKDKRTFIGANYWPHPDVVFKVDYQFDNPQPGMEEDDRINLGVGFQF